METVHGRANSLTMLQERKKMHGWEMWEEGVNNTHTRVHKYSSKKETRVQIP